MSTIPIDIQTAIAAAVYATVGSGVRIVSMSPAQVATRLLWAQEGRREIFLSHRFQIPRVSVRN